jgi:hypothetical protein
VTAGLTALAALSCVVVAACASREGSVITTRDGGAASPAGSCPAAARAIRVLDAAARLALFDPATSAVTGEVSPACPGGLLCAATAAWGASPLSLAMDRSGSLWLSACNGEIDRFDVATGQCGATGLTTETLGFDGITMTFARAAASGAGAAAANPEDLLAIAGSSSGLPALATSSSTLGVVRQTGTPFERVAGLSGWPGLSATPGGSVWAFFPPTAGGAIPSLAELDLRTGASVRSVTPATEVWAAPAPAFVVFRGEGVLFAAQGSATSPTTQVFRISLANGALLGTTILTGRLVVAATVSTCAAAP